MIDELPIKINEICLLVCVCMYVYIYIYIYIYIYMEKENDLSKKKTWTSQNTDFIGKNKNKTEWVAIQ